MAWRDAVYFALSVPRAHNLFVFPVSKTDPIDFGFSVPSACMLRSLVVRSSTIHRSS
jgi:hypothetical protein